MQELIDRIAASANLAPETARKALGTVLGFISREAPEGEVAKLLDAMPGSRDLLASDGGGSAPAMGGMGAMAVFNQLTALGLSLPQVQTLARETLAYGREHAGEDTMGEIVASVPGLDQVL
jgi:hypothetical protein